jgi:alkanesulfonate monooxygenase SsuD/methylene tetrahydromethanopterin reductase-like flavin-dependent oxidoreductase (luciferase family)
MKVYVTFRGSSLSDLRERVRLLEAIGVSGVFIGDHLFVSGAGRDTIPERPLEPTTALAAIATLSDRLHIGTSVSNLGFLHPALVLRQFASLAALFGGERVLAGIGAGWNRPEFEALGMRMPSFDERMVRLEEAARLARELFDTGVATVHGSQVVANNLPLRPRPSTPPRLFLGGGSDRLLDIAGRYADALDLNGSSRRSTVAGPDLPAADARRRLSTTVADLEASVERVRTAARSAGRPADAVKTSVLIGNVEMCSAAEVADVTRRITGEAGLPAQHSLDECPYVLIGEPARMADALLERRERVGLDAVILAGSLDPRPFMEEVFSRLPQPGGVR